jgi:predicted transcriptional regulator
MASPSIGSVVLLPIQPQYATPILGGTKQVEFRKRPFRRDVTHVVVYSSSPIQQVVGFFELLGIDEDSPEQLWRRYSRVGGITKMDYDRYYASTPRGVAIRVGRVHVLREPLPLARVDPDLHPPQSYAYLSDRAFARVRAQRFR